jgi:hypothetical protein
MVLFRTLLVAALAAFASAESISCTNCVQQRGSCNSSVVIPIGKTTAFEVGFGLDPSSYRVTVATFNNDRLTIVERNGYESVKQETSTDVSPGNSCYESLVPMGSIYPPVPMTIFITCQNYFTSCNIGVDITFVGGNQAPSPVDPPLPLPSPSPRAADSAFAGSVNYSKQLLLVPSADYDCATIVADPLVVYERECKYSPLLSAYVQVLDQGQTLFGRVCTQSGCADKFCLEAFSVTKETCSKVPGFNSIRFTGYTLSSQNIQLTLSGNKDCSSPLETNSAVVPAACTKVSNQVAAAVGNTNLYLSVAGLVESSAPSVSRIVFKSMCSSSCNDCLFYGTAFAGTCVRVNAMNAAVPIYGRATIQESRSDAATLWTGSKLVVVPGMLVAYHVL